jgi:hypothetical protein
MTSSLRASASGPVVSFWYDDFQTNRLCSIESSFAVQVRHIVLGLRLYGWRHSAVCWLFICCRRFRVKATETSDQLSLLIRGVDARLLAIRNDWLWHPRQVMIDDVLIKGIAGDRTWSCCGLARCKNIWCIHIVQFGSCYWSVMFTARMIDLRCRQVKINGLLHQEKPKVHCRALWRCQAQWTND